ncbi:hypothetical protein [Ruegeria arenilitoris]|uniref:hypothetical protein n=1 Tax=Ruegeria arenilitoris TaxID=1173585 RepID=UPI00147CE308|nr:hypothetical protein [Ruegeria arenilitoris]
MNSKNTSTSSKNTAGKRVGGTIYLHASALQELEPKLLLVFEKAKAAVPEGFAWSVVKMDLRSPNRVSFLNYEDFDKAVFPALRSSCTIDANTGLSSVRKYSTENPPILHRKELLLASDDPKRIAFSVVTKRLEELGLFKNMHKMGHRRAWEEALKLSGEDLKFIKATNNLA